MLLAIDRQKTMDPLYDMLYEMKAKAAYFKEKDLIPLFIGMAKGLHDIH